jgi:predicted Rossmann-fold nucleotide-binding protein
MLEIITWSQLNIHSKPILLLNTKGFYKLFADFIQLSVQGTQITRVEQTFCCGTNALFYFL